MQHPIRFIFSALLALSLGPVVLAQSSTPARVSFVTTAGETIDNAKIMRVEPDGLSVMLPTGIAKIPAEQLPEDVQSRFHITPESAARYRQRTATRAAQSPAKDDMDKVHASYAWHSPQSTTKGKLICLKDGWVLVGNGYWPIYMDSHLIRFADLPLSEQQRAVWISERLSPAEIQQGQDGLRFWLYQRDH